MNYIAKILMNSLYGRFGMDDSFNEITIIDKDLLNKFLDEYPTIEIIEMLELDNKYLIKFKSSIIDIDNNDIDKSNNLNINIAIASAITSYSRIHMSQFKNNSDYKLFQYICKLKLVIST